MRRRIARNPCFGVGLPAGAPPEWDEVTERPCPECDDGEMILKCVGLHKRMWVCTCGHTIDPAIEVML